MCIVMMEKLVEPTFHQEVTQLLAEIMDTCMTVPLATEPPIAQCELQL